MRITGGLGRGLPLRSPTGRSTRPATDRLREAVFSSLGAAVSGVRVLDLFAGSGAYGLEAASRGAEGVVFVENSRGAVAAIRENIATLGRAFDAQQQARPEMRVMAQDVRRFPLETAAADLIFCDPPYDRIDTTAPEIFRRLGEAGENGRERTLVLELPGGSVWDVPGWTLRRRLGKPARDAPNAAIFEQD